MSISWTSFKLPHIWYLIGLHSILQKKDKLVKSINEFRKFGVENLLNGFLIENSQIDVDCFENTTAETTTVAYLVSNTEIICSSQQI